MVSDDPTFRTDGGVPTGTAILADERGRSLEWHHSVEFDGFVHKTACDRVIDTDDVRDALVELPEAWNREVARTDGCSTCSRSISDLEDDVATDGGHSAGGTDRIGPGWYVIEGPHQDPAHVVAGPKDADDAESHARFLTDPNARIMHTPALVNAIKNDGYNVEWGPEAEKPTALKGTGGDR